MIWPQRRRPSTPPLPPEYALRPAHRGDDQRFCALLAAAGWPDWTEERLRAWLPRIPPQCWLLVTQHGTDNIVATAMGLEDPTSWHPRGGEVGWVACHPAHRGRGLGAVVTAAVTRRLRELGYAQIHLFTEDERLPALRMYLRLGFVPYLDLPDMRERWQAVCQAMGQPFTPEAWPTAGIRL
jgi:mycothiol synthase